MLSRALVAFAITLLGGYGLMEAYPLIRGPVLMLSSPKDYATFESGIVPVYGNATRVVALTLNGAPILPNEDGSFSFSLAYPRGSSILTFVAKNRFGRTITQTRTIYIP